MKLLSYGKKLENLIISLENKLIGSNFTTFKDKIKTNDTVLFVCHSLVWGMANVCSEVFEDHKILWNDKLYPHRAKIDSIVIFDEPFKFSDHGIDKIFRDNLGNQWAFKVLFTPNKIPFDAEEVLLEVLDKQKPLSEDEVSEYLQQNAIKYEKLKRKRLGLD